MKVQDRVSGYQQAIDPINDEISCRSGLCEVLANIPTLCFEMASFEMASFEMTTLLFVQANKYLSLSYI